ncbi:MAG: helix-turn-helix domain-containing protein [Verrucomicrobiota bacterium]
MSGNGDQKAGYLLKFERRKAGVSQRELARRTGLTQATISKLESGDSNFRIDTLEQYVDALGMKLNLISKDAELYHYVAQVLSVYDGDTCRVDIDLGMGTWIRNEKLRLSRINAPEMTGPEKARGTVARDALRELILGREVIIETIKDKRGKYGRYLAEIWLPENDGFININDLLVAKGYAEYKEY